MLPPPTPFCFKAYVRKQQDERKKNESTVNTLYQDASVDYGHAPETIALMI